MDQNMNRKFINSSFLMLDLRTNTIGVGNYHAHQNTVYPTQIQANANINNKKVIDDERSSPCNFKRFSNEEENFESVTKKKLRTTKSSYNSRSCPPPPYLIRLLAFFHWKVNIQGGKNGEYRYISPSGISYFPNSIAYEAFLLSTSKYSEKGSILSRYLQSSSYPCTGRSYFGMRRGNIGIRVKKRRRQRKKKTNFENIFKPFDSTDPVSNNDKEPVQVTNEKTKCFEDDRELSIGVNEDIPNRGGRRENNIEEYTINDEVANLVCQKKRAASKGKGSTVLRRSERLNNKINISNGGVDLVKQKENNENRRTSIGGSSSSSKLNDNKMHSHIRRSARINQNRVPVYDNSNDERWFENPSNFKTSVEGNPQKEKKAISSFDYNNKQLMDTNNTSHPKLKGPPKRRNTEIAIKENNVSGNKKTKGKRRCDCRLSFVRRKRYDNKDEIMSQRKLNIITQLIELGTLVENDKISFVSKNDISNTTGIVTKNGIWCFCCAELVWLPEFVAHANGDLDLYYDCIFLPSGKTLLACMKEAWEKVKVESKVNYKNFGLGDSDPGDDSCVICADGGNLICCDSCPSSFHQSCLMLETFPEGDWYCPHCRCKICGTSCLENMLSCKQCGHKYHKDGCRENHMMLMDILPNSFCGRSCKNVSAKLKSILGRKNQTEDGFSWTLLKCLYEDVERILIKRLSFTMETNIKLSMASCVLNECFERTIDRRTNLDVLCQAIYNCGSNFKRLDYEGFYTLILEKDEDIISVASLRLHGTSLAEMPFICTRVMYQNQGMCRRFMKEVENMLCELCVEKLVIPAIPEMLETWTRSFSFKPLEISHKEEIKNLSLVVFPGTTLLQKPMHKSTGVGKDVPIDNSFKRIKYMQHDVKAVPKSSNASTSGEPRIF